METKDATVVLWMMLSNMLKPMVLSLKLNILILLEPPEFQENAKLMQVLSKSLDSPMLPKVA